MKKLVKNGNCYYYGSIFDKRVIINVETFVITIINLNKVFTIFDPMWIQGSIAEAENEKEGVLLLAEYLYDNN